MEILETYWKENNWKVADITSTPTYEKQLADYTDLGLSKYSLGYLNSFAPQGIYFHQKEAIKLFKQYMNTCLCTGTASGKSLPFYVTGIETLVNDPTSRIVAIYPIKALGVEQEERWKKALEMANLDVEVGRIDGQVPSTKRKQILKQCRIVIITPDVIHAWLLSNLTDRVCVNFIKSISLIIVDEVHTYTGVFGSNSAFLFRRLRHLMHLCDKAPQFICASATISNPDDHLLKLFGVPFSIIGSSFDTSPKHGMEIVMLDPPKQVDFLNEIAQLLLKIASTKGRFIAFVDSRKQTEILATILSRGQADDEESEDDEVSVSLNYNHLDALQILPYRAGYEESDRTVIQKRLTNGLLHGIISTSALELGLDIPNLEVAVLVGVPNSSTSLFQRIGRIGRHKKGTVYIINSGGFYDEMVFRHPDRLLKRPLAESTLYLENSRIQYIHTLCLARPGGEHDQMLSMIHGNEDGLDSFSSTIEWPDGFLQLCRAERIGEISTELQAIKLEAGDDPNHIYPLRDVESQFKVELKQGPEQRQLGSLSYSQVLREAYPGAVYYYTTKTFRVYKVNTQSKIILVRKEKRYTTSPTPIPTLVFPNLSDGNVYHAKQHEKLIVIESNLQVRESIAGYKERRGPSETTFPYPLKASQTSVYFDYPRFTRNYFTSGVVFTHPKFNDDNVYVDSIAKLLYEAFLISIPFERQDLDYAVDRHRTSKSSYFIEGNRFIAIFDKTYGSLRLSGHVMQENLMTNVFNQAIELSEIDESVELNATTIEIIKQLAKESKMSGNPISFESNSFINSDEMFEKIILPNSIGMSIQTGNQEFRVESVFFNPRQGGLCYRGRYLTQNNLDTSIIILPINLVLEIPGESIMGYYNFESGEVQSI